MTRESLALITKGNVIGPTHVPHAIKLAAI